jgi:hypothetical protein
MTNSCTNGASKALAVPAPPDSLRSPRGPACTWAYSVPASVLISVLGIVVVLCVLRLYQPGKVLFILPVLNSVSYDHALTVVGLSASQPFQQTFTARENGLSAIHLQFAGVRPWNRDVIEWSMEDVTSSVNHVVGSGAFSLSYVRDWEYAGFRFQPLTESRGRRYRLSLRARSQPDGNAGIPLFAGIDDTPYATPGQNAAIDLTRDNPSTGHACSFDRNRPVMISCTSPESALAGLRIRLAPETTEPVAWKLMRGPRRRLTVIAEGQNTPEDGNLTIMFPALKDSAGFAYTVSLSARTPVRLPLVPASAGVSVYQQDPAGSATEGLAPVVTTLHDKPAATAVPRMILTYMAQ